MESHNYKKNTVRKNTIYTFNTAFARSPNTSVYTVIRRVYRVTITCLYWCRLWTLVACFLLVEKRHLKTMVDCGCCCEKCDFYWRLSKKLRNWTWLDKGLSLPVSVTSMWRQTTTWIWSFSVLPDKDGHPFFVKLLRMQLSIYSTNLLVLNSLESLFMVVNC